MPVQASCECGEIDGCGRRTDTPQGRSAPDGWAGYRLARAGIESEATAMSPITALWFVALAVYELFTTAVRRVLKGVSPLSGDRLHLHYLLQDYGLTARQTLMVFSVLAMLGGAIGLSTHLAGVSDNRVFALFVMCFGAYFFGIRRLAKGVLSATVAGHESPACSTLAR